MMNTRHFHFRSPMSLTMSMGCLLALAVSLPVTGPAQPAQLGNEISAYYIGNSLVRNIPLSRLEELFEAAGGDLEVGSQLGGGHRLEQHLVKRNHGNAPGEGKYNNLGGEGKRYGDYDQAFQHHTFDAVVLQPFADQLDKEMETMNYWPWNDGGTLQAASALITYARGEVEPGEGRWDLENPNTDNVAADRFYIYATWPGADQALEAGGYSEFWNMDYEPGSTMSNADFFAQLVEALNQGHPDLPHPVRMIPVGHVLAALDGKIRAGELPGIEAFYERNQPYYRKSRRNNKGPSPFDPEHFDPAGGVLNFYADGIHMNDQPHNGRDSGSIGAYVVALTHYATLTGERAVGLTAGPYEQFDAEKDAELIRALQETVDSVVFGGSAVTAGAEPGTVRTWTDIRGNSFEGRLISADADSALLERVSDRKRFDVSFENLSARDRQHLESLR